MNSNIFSSQGMGSVVVAIGLVGAEEATLAFLKGPFLVGNYTKTNY